MKVHRAEDGPLELGPTVASLGVFDGVHRGHVHLLREGSALARDEGWPMVAVVPDRHPRTVVDPDNLPRILTDLPHRFELLETVGVDHVYVLRFDEERSLQPAEDFMEEVLVGQVGATALVAGEDFHFGHRRKGDAALVASLAASMGLKTVTVPLLRDEHAGEVISSTLVREVLAAGRVDRASELLGRPHELRGIVEHGDARGRTIGFPTANVAVPGAIALPADGVYAGWYVDPDGVAHASAINIGRRPTFYDENGLLLVEAHLIDFDGDLYGQHAGVRVVHHLREEIRFAGVEALVEQLGRDVARAREVLA